MSRTSRHQEGRAAIWLLALLVLFVLGYLGAYRVEWLAQGKPTTWCPTNDNPLNRFGPGAFLSIIPLWFIVDRAFKYRGGCAAAGLSFLLLGGMVLYFATMR